MELTFQSTGAATINRVEMAQAQLSTGFDYLIALHNRNRVAKIRVLALDLKQAAVSGELKKAITEVSNQRATRGLQRSIVRIRNADVFSERGADAAGSAYSAVEYGDLNLG